MADIFLKVTDPKKVVTDKVVLKELVRQGIDKDYVEFHEDYSAEHPFQKIYKDKKSSKFIMSVCVIPKVRPDGKKIKSKWYKKDEKYYCEPNLFEAIVDGTAVKVVALDSRPDGTKAGDSVSWNPQLFINNEQVFPISDECSLLHTDPIDDYYSDNTLEWDYGVCKRRIQLANGNIRERWYFDEKPAGTISIKHNRSGEIKLRLGHGLSNRIDTIPVQVIDNDEERLDVSDIEFPIEIGASPESFNDTSNSGIKSETATGVTWATIHGTGTATQATGLIALGTMAGAATWRLNFRWFSRFNTSALPTTATITNAVLNLGGTMSGGEQMGTPALGIVSSSAGGTYATADYTLYGTTLYSNTINFSSWNDSGNNAFTFNSTGRGSVSKTGYSDYCAIESNYDRANSAPTAVANKQNWLWINTSTPQLVVTYTLPAPSAPTNVAATDGTHTDKVTVTWTKSSGATAYRVYRNGANVSGTLGDVATYDHTGATAPTITAGTATASEGTSKDHVTLSLAGESANNGASQTYTVYAYNGTWSSVSSGNTGYRGVGSLVKLWYRSAADSDASYSSTGGTTDPYNDTGAPSDGSGRYYKCYLTATGASAVYSSVDRGYRLSTPAPLFMHQLQFLIGR